MTTPKPATPPAGQHTPGPWRVQTEIERSVPGREDRLVRRIYRDDGKGWACVAEIHASGCKVPSEREANGRLIAAAPELLESVERSAVNRERIRRAAQALLCRVCWPPGKYRCGVTRCARAWRILKALDDDEEYARAALARVGGQR